MGLPELRLPLLLVTAVGTLAFNFSVILPLFATRDLDGAATTFTTLISIMSIGSVVGALTIARRTDADTAFLARCTLALGVSMVALALAPGTWTAYLAVIPVGVTSIMVISGSNAVVQLATAPAMRGRVLALLAVVFLGSTPIGGPITGWISETFGARWALALGAVTSLVAGALTLRALHGTKGAEAAHLDPARIESAPRRRPRPLTASAVTRPPAELDVDRGPPGLAGRGRGCGATRPAARHGGAGDRLQRAGHPAAAGRQGVHLPRGRRRRASPTRR